MDKSLEKNEIIIFDNQEVVLEIEIESETIWLSQKSIAKLFGVGIPAIC